ncbi:DUF2834 domain-containing protein [Kitasatospora purpeofusca]|uniref:DUF2834 domain-containing protein n=1 Tax=Kitasatospora purpeofusca TaxID=67352 RepID=A0ABZ1TU52_9ACTN|nr:DUF2834 domain-containing protein [Kitasatospora purpeofusca]
MRPPEPHDRSTPHDRDRALRLMYALCGGAGFLVMATMAVTFVVRNADAGPWGVMRNFLRDATGNLASDFVYADLALTWAALAAFMVVEARRWRIRHVWAYIVGAPALALVVSFSVFMYVRQSRIAAAREPAAPRTVPTVPTAPASKGPQR